MHFTSLKSLVILALGFTTLAAARPSISLELDLVDSVVERVVDLFAPNEPELHLVPEAVQIVQSDGTIAVVDSDAEWAQDDEEVDTLADIAGYLNSHNQFRAQHGARALAWDNNLAAKAQQWANRCQFKHSGGTLGPYGENLAAGTGKNYGAAQAVKGWTDEIGQYDPRNPKPSHFTQVVWKNSQRIGCAVASCSGIFDPKYGKAEYHVCEYYPAGNVIGQFPQNVQK